MSKCDICRKYFPEEELQRLWLIQQSLPGKTLKDSKNIFPIGRICSRCIAERQTHSTTPSSHAEARS
jgi:hypothetical protein